MGNFEMTIKFVSLVIFFCNIFSYISGGRTSDSLAFVLSVTYCSTDYYYYCYATTTTATNTIKIYIYTNKYNNKLLTVRVNQVKI